MLNTKKIALPASAHLAQAALIAPVYANTACAQEQVVKMGHVGPTSGGIAHLGKDSENGARLAIEELNAKGVKLGGKRVHFELLPKTMRQIPSREPSQHRNWSTPRSMA